MPVAKTVAMSLALVAALLASGQSAKFEFDPHAGPKPLAVLIETEPWASVIGADVPKTAVYEDGLVVYWNPKKSDYFTKRLSGRELSEFKAKLSFLGKLDAVKRRYDNNGPTDQPYTKIFVEINGVRAASSVYAMDFLRKDQLKGVDAPALRLLEGARTLLSGLSYPDAKPWTPQFVEAMIWPFEHAVGATIPWPKDWPGLDSLTTFERHGQSYSIFLPGAKVMELHRLVDQMGDHKALSLEGKKWSLSYRPVFPSEPVWQGAFNPER